LRRAFGCGLDAVVLQDRFDRVPSDVVAEVLQSATNPRVAPGRILARHAHDQRRDVRLGIRTTRAPRLRTVVLRGDQQAVPAQDRIGRDDAGDVGEAPLAEGLPFDGQTASLGVGEANPWGPYRA